MVRLLRFAWIGFRLRCPACGDGSMASGPFRLHPHCPACGAVFEPEEGDFLGAMLVAYSVTAVLLAIGIYLVAAFTTLTAIQHLLLWAVVGTLFLILSYRNMKGLWIGILHAMVGLKRT